MNDYQTEKREKSVTTNKISKTLDERIRRNKPNITKSVPISGTPLGMQQTTSHKKIRGHLKNTKIIGDWRGGSNIRMDL